MALYAVARQARLRIGARLGEKPALNLCIAMASRLVRHPSLTLWVMLTTVKVEFRMSAYLGGALAAYLRKWWGGASTDGDDWFDRGCVEAAWSDVFISADGLPWALKGVVQVRGKGVNCRGLFGQGKGLCRRGVGVYGSGERCRLAPRPVSRHMKKGKHRIFVLTSAQHLVDYTSETSEQSIPLTIASSRFGTHRSHFLAMILTRRTISRIA